MLLVDAFLTKYQRSVESLKQKGIGDPLVTTGFAGLVQAVRQSEKVYFAPSTMLMLTEKLRHYSETMQELSTYAHSIDINMVFQRAFSSDGSWITYDRPIAMPGPADIELYPKTLALFFFVPARYIATGTDSIQVYFIDQEANPYDMMSMTQEKREWQIDPVVHQCPLRATAHGCKKQDGILTLCETCEAFLAIWTKIFGLSAIIAGQYLAARRYEEKTFTVIRHIPREKNEKKTRKVPVGYLFKVIDATEIIIQVPAQQEQEQRTKVPQGSWVLEAMAEGDLDYKETQTRPFTRTYRSERYVNVRGTTQEFPEGIERKQPIRKSLQGKHMTKVKASAYEEEQNQSE